MTARNYIPAQPVQRVSEYPSRSVIPARPSRPSGIQTNHNHRHSNHASRDGQAGMPILLLPPPFVEEGHFYTFCQHIPTLECRNEKINSPPPVSSNPQSARSIPAFSQCPASPRPRTARNSSTMHWRITTPPRTARVAPS